MRLFFLALLSLCMVFAAPVFADPTPVPSGSPAAAGDSVLDVAKGRLATMFTTGHADAAWFTDDFLAQVPASKVDEIVAQLVKALGAYKSVEFTPQAFVVHFEHGTDNVLMHVNAAGKIDMLYFKPPSVASLDRALRTLSQLPGTVSERPSMHRSA